MHSRSREFYEKYFIEQDFSAEERLKQFERVLSLKNFFRTMDISGFGLAVGVGKGAELEVAQGKVVALDLPYTYLPTVKQNFPEALVIQGDGTLLPFRDNTFDWLLCSEVLEHIPNREDMISEFARVLKPAGNLILTTPNRICLYGIARFIAELLSGKTVHAGEQPLDNWVTPWGLKSEFAQYFKIRKMRGWWYFPPIGIGDFQLFPRIFAAIWKLLMPIERFLRVALPWFGHSICIVANPIKKS